jgi:hypothetical protein
MVSLPRAGVKAALVSMRADVHLPDFDLSGTSWTVPPPEIWRLRLDVE